MIRPSCPVPRLVLSALFMVFVSEARADIFADIPGIPGESTSPVALGQIVLRSASFGSERGLAAVAKQKTSAACTAKTSAQICEVFITKGVDKASPKLFMAAAAGTRFPTVTLNYFANDVSGPTQYLKIVLANALIDSISSSGSTLDTPTESVRLTCTSMETTYSKKDEAGQTQTETATATFCQAPF